MNSEQITSVLRSVLQFAGGLAVSRGFITGGELEIIIGIIASVIALGMSVWTRRNAGLVASAAAVPAVAKIEAAPSVAAAVPSPKVVPAGGL